MLDGVREQFASPVQIIASVQNPVDFRALLRSLLHLVEIAIVGIERVLGLFEPKSVFLLRPPIAH